MNKRTSDPFRKIVTLPLFVVLPFVMSACMTIDAGRSTPDKFTVYKTHPQSVRLVVKGGVESAFGGMQEAPTDIIMQAASKSIEKSRLFTTIKNDNSADLQLDITVFKMGQQLDGGLNYTQFLYANWRLRDLRTRKILFQERIDTRHRVTVREAISGNKRTVYATEGAIRKNIQEGISRISKLEIPR